MFGLILVSGESVNHFGRDQAVLTHTILAGISVTALQLASSVLLFSLSMFILGLGRKFAFVSATAVVTAAAQPPERGKITGLTDLPGDLFGALLSVSGGARFAPYGLPGIVLPSMTLLAVPRSFTTM